MSEEVSRDTDLARVALDLAEEITGTDAHEVSRVPKGVMTHKFRVRMRDGQDLLVRMYPEGRAHVVNYEPDLLRRCAREGVLVPEVVTDSRSGPDSRLNYMVYRWIEGRSLAETPGVDADELASVCGSVVENLRRMARIEVQGFGELGDGLHATESSWSSFVRRSFEGGLEMAQRRKLFDPSILDKLKRVRQDLESFLEPMDAELVWGDLSTEHVILDRSNRLCGLIDLEGTLIGDPLATLGHCYASHAHQPFFEAIVRAWPEPLGDAEWNRIYFYGVLRVVRIAQFADQPLPTGCERAPLTSVFPGLQAALSNLRV